MMASVLPTRETPVYCDLFHSPRFTDASAWATFLLRAHMRAMPCSAAATVLAVGALTTKHPYCRWSEAVLLLQCTVNMPRPSALCGSLLACSCLLGTSCCYVPVNNAVFCPGYARLVTSSDNMLNGEQNSLTHVPPAQTLLRKCKPSQHTSVAACRSTLSIPTPALPTTFKRPLLASKTARVTCQMQPQSALGFESALEQLELQLLSCHGHQQ